MEFLWWQWTIGNFEILENVFLTFGLCEYNELRWFIFYFWFCLLLLFWVVYFCYGFVFVMSLWVSVGLFPTTIRQLSLRIKVGPTSTKKSWPPLHLLIEYEAGRANIDKTSWPPLHRAPPHGIWGRSGQHPRKSPGHHCTAHLLMEYEAFWANINKTSWPPLNRTPPHGMRQALSWSSL